MLTVAVLALTGGCTTVVPGLAQPGATDAPVARTSPKPLPFIPKVKGRTNDRNDGTTFEPCAEYVDDELVALDIDPETLTDAAISNSANYRGCHWRGSDYTSRYGGTQYSQIVGRKMSLEEYKRYMSMMPWQADRIVHGRTLALAAELDSCTAVFASQQAIVATIVSATNPSPGNTVECEKAVAFASLAITKAPR